jgi:hypothetical protein
MFFAVTITFVDLTRVQSRDYWFKGFVWKNSCHSFCFFTVLCVLLAQDVINLLKILEKRNLLRHFIKTTEKPLPFGKAYRLVVRLESSRTTQKQNYKTGECQKNAKMLTQIRKTTHYKFVPPVQTTSNYAFNFGMLMTFRWKTPNLNARKLDLVSWQCTFHTALPVKRILENQININFGEYSEFVWFLSVWLFHIAEFKISLKGSNFESLEKNYSNVTTVLKEL